MTDKISFEQSLCNLENIIQKLEEGNISLDETVINYKEGMDFAANCLKLLNQAEAEISLYENGQFVSIKEGGSGLS
ncbi:exodeoxyribonuclease VII small subunit [Candidatus Epulonipiscium viviparus]|uniref:exodeoxyribonuclease VII small subunit n=1 Tax=Candidatus Epulonipiscium viviparus TaxID=420336 RepID=UPI00016C04B8|nr:exodeoxyribonuclease VII small subunit [Candidatus Epulopiscium viviparus]